MMKFFRTHTKKLLSVFMGLLLIVWLGGPALQNMFSVDMAGVVLANTTSGDVLAIDRQRATSQTGLLSRLGINWTQPMASVGAATEPLGVLDWILLTREAERYGITVGQFEAERFLTGYGLTPDFVARFATGQDRKVADIHDAVAAYLAVRKVADITLASTVRSEAHIRRAVRDEFELVKVHLVTLMAADYVDSEEEFSDAQLEEHFNEFRDTDSGEGLLFGYRQLPQVKLQYFKIDVDEMAWNLHKSERTLEARAKDYWRRNRESDEFMKGAEDLYEGEEIDDSGPQYFEDFDEVRDIALTAVRREFAESKIDEVAGWLTGALTDPWHDYDEGDDGYKVGPADVVNEAHLAKILERMPATLRHGNAVTIHTTDYLTTENASSKAPELARATTRGNDLSGVRQISDLAFQVRGIVTIPDSIGASTAEYLAIGQTYPRALSARGDRFVFRVLDVTPAGPAGSLSDVRDRVLADMRLHSAYEKAIQAAESLVGAVTEEGLEKAFEADEELKAKLKESSGFFSPPAFSRRMRGTTGLAGYAGQVSIPGVGLVDKDFVKRCFEPGEVENLEKVFVIPTESSATATVVQFVEIYPLRENRYKRERSQIARQLNRAVLATAVDEWLNPVRIRDRNGWSVPSN